jgi:hypothetical protein
MQNAECTNAEGTNAEGTNAEGTNAHSRIQKAEGFKLQNL